MSRERTPARRGLGRGLGSLIPTAPDRGSRRLATVAAGRTRAGGARGQLVRRGAGRADRARTACSRVRSSTRRRWPSWCTRIREVGLLQPVVVRQLGRRAATSWSWASGAGGRPSRPGSTAIPAIVRATDDTDMLRDALLENLHRSQLNPLEEAAAYQQLLEDFGCTHDELAAADRPVAPADLQHHPAAQALAGRAAAGGRRRAQRGPRALAARRSRTPTSRTGWPLAWWPRASASGAWRRSSRPVARRRPRPPTPRRNKPVAPGLTDLAERLSDRFETRVKVDLGRHKGKITVEFASLDDLRRIVDIMDPRNRSRPAHLSPDLRKRRIVDKAISQLSD